MFHHLTLKQLESFYWAARLGSFSAAAGRLNTTQPSISIRIRDMEEILDVSLFERRGRRRRLTAKGRELAAQVERVITLGEEFDAALGRREAVSGLVRIGAADTVALTWLPELVAEVGRLYPAVTIELIVDLSVNLRLRLHNGDLDLAFLVGGINRPEFENRPLGGVEQRWMCSPSLGIGPGVLDGAKLAAWPVVTHSRGSDLYHSVRRWFTAEGCWPGRLHGCSSLAAMIALTAAGLGVSVLPADMLEEEAASGELMVIPTIRPVPANQFLVTVQAQPLRQAVAVVADLGEAIARTSPVFHQADQQRGGARGDRKLDPAGAREPRAPRHSY